MIRWLNDCSVDWLLDWLVDSLFGWLLGKLIGCSVDCSAGWWAVWTIQESDGRTRYDRTTGSIGRSQNLSFSWSVVDRVCFTSSFNPACAGRQPFDVPPHASETFATNSVGGQTLL